MSSRKGSWPMFPMFVPAWICNDLFERETVSRLFHVVCMSLVYSIVNESTIDRKKFKAWSGSVFSDILGCSFIIPPSNLHTSFPR